MKIIALVLLVLLFAPAFSPRVTHGAPPATVPATPVATATVAATSIGTATAAATVPAVIIAAPVDAASAPVTSVPDGYISIWVTILIAIGSAIVAGVATGASVARVIVTILEKANNNPALIESLEKAAEGLRTSVQADDLLRAVSLGAQLAGKITDGIPENMKTPPAKQDFVPTPGLESTGKISVEDLAALGIRPPSFPAAEPGVVG